MLSEAGAPLLCLSPLALARGCVLLACPPWTTLLLAVVVVVVQMRVVAVVLVDLEQAQG